MNYLVDTNILIDHLRIGERKATEFLNNVEQGNLRASISVITEYELLASEKISLAQRKLIERLLKILPSISITSSMVKEAVNFTHKYRFGMADSLIAATAFQTDSVLVTRDKIFSKAEEIKTETLN